MDLVKYEMFRLYDLVETQIEGNCHYVRAPFSDELNDHFDLDTDVDGDFLGFTLNSLTDAIYGDGCGRWFEITDNMHYGKWEFRVEINDDERLEIQDITPRILDLSKDTRLFILVDEQFTQYKWVVAELQGTVYSG